MRRHGMYESKFHVFLVFLKPVALADSHNSRVLNVSHFFVVFEHPVDRSSGSWLCVSQTKIGGAGNGGKISTGITIPGTDKLQDYVDAVQKLPDADHVRKFK